MKNTTKVCALFVVLTALNGSIALAQGYPTRSIQLIVPFPAGGSTDLVARAVAEPLRERLGQAVVVENRAGGGGIVGTEAAARAQADGYTIVMGGSGNVALAALNAGGRGMDWIHDFKPIAIIGDIPNVVVVAADKKLESVADVIARAKAAPGEINYGHAGNGTASHLVGELFARQAEIKIIPVPYRGNQPVVTDLLGGHIPLMFSNLAGTLPFMDGDKLKILATTGKARSPLTPHLPTFGEAGIAGLENGVWMGFLAPKGTPDVIIATLTKHIEEVMKDPSTVERLKKLGTETVYAGPAEFNARMMAEYALWKQIITEANIKLQ